MSNALQPKCWAVECSNLQPKKKKTVQFYEKPTSQDQLASLAYILIKQTNTIYKPFHNSQL